MFPSQWMQTWMPYPYQSNRNIAWHLQWWSLSGAYDPFTDFGLLSLLNAITVWHHTIFAGLLHNVAGAQAILATIYIKGSAGLYSTQWSNPLVHWTNGNTLPLSHGVVVRRYTGILGPRGRGRVFVPAVPINDVDGLILKPAVQLAWQAACDHMLDTITHAGITFTPSLCSMVAGTLTPLTRVMVTPRLGLTHRRARIRPRTPPMTPKMPPP